MKSEAEKNLDYYRNLPYGINLRKDDEGDWVARIEELQGCVAHGSTPADAMSNLEEVRDAWIEDALETGDAIPEPDATEILPSGKWLQRVPRSLHKKISELAEREGVSLNQLVTSILAEAVGRRDAGALPSLEASAATPVRVLQAQGAGRRWKAFNGAIYMKISESLHDWHVDTKVPVRRLNIIDALVSPVSSLPNRIDETEFRIIERAAKKELTYKA